jgi:hypothetical protein
VWTLTNVAEEVEKLEPSCISGGNLKWHRLLENTLAVPRKVQKSYNTIEQHLPLNIFPRQLKKYACKNTCSYCTQMFMITSFAIAKIFLCH